ncbi:MAG: glycosyltransferase family 2 protein [Thomasclavelia sp.]|uniref:glycosyltransferase family 2 protein n=1 Tax=Thomasclavelia sp. TaxID=3025757 RepID=UPI0039A1C3B8
MALLTVFTLTYNRAYCLNKCYESLLRQTSKDFEWLIIDDGSTDNTKEIVEGWIKENHIPISYIYKKNGGMHSGYNMAYDNIFTELAVCIDSDDYMTDNAVELITNFWKKNKTPQYAGIVGLDITADKNIIGKPLPNKKSMKVYDYYNRLNGSGDKKMIYRPELIRPFKSPEFEEERLFPTCYKYYMVDLNYDMLILNEPLCIVEYMEDGFTSNIMKSYKKNLNSYIYYRKFILTYPNATVAHKFRFAIHYVAECLLNKEEHWLRNVPMKRFVVPAIIPGIFLYCYLSLRT